MSLGRFEQVFIPQQPQETQEKYTEDRSVVLGATEI